MGFRDELVAEIAKFETELRSLKAALAAYDEGNPRPPVFGGPSPDDLPLNTAIRAYLEWAHSRGNASVSAGELFQAISAHKVTTTRGGQLLAQTRHPWRGFCITLRSNPGTFHVDTTPIRKSSAVKSIRK